MSQHRIRRDVFKFQNFPKTVNAENWRIVFDKSRWFSNQQLFIQPNLFLLGCCGVWGFGGANTMAFTRIYWATKKDQKNGVLTFRFDDFSDIAASLFEGTYKYATDYEESKGSAIFSVTSASNQTHYVKKIKELGFKSPYSGGLKNPNTPWNVCLWQISSEELVEAVKEYRKKNPNTLRVKVVDTLFKKELVIENSNRKRGKKEKESFWYCFPVASVRNETPFKIATWDWLKSHHEMKVSPLNGSLYSAAGAYKPAKDDSNQNIYLKLEKMD